MQTNLTIYSANRPAEPSQSAGRSPYRGDAVAMAYLPERRAQSNGTVPGDRRRGRDRRSGDRSVLRPVERKEPQILSTEFATQILGIWQQRHGSVDPRRTNPATVHNSYRAYAAPAADQRCAGIERTL